MTVDARNNIPGHYSRPDRESLARETRQQADAVIALRRMLAQACSRKELRLFSAA